MFGYRPGFNKDNRWFAPVILAFILVYIFSLTFVYVEGDDASSIAYHLLGRNFKVQPPYSPYHGMMDLLLGFLPQDELLLHNTAVSLTAVAAPLLVILILTLTFKWFKNLALPPKWLIAIVILLSVPEFFYLGLVYLPSVIAMSLVIASHLVLRSAIENNPIQFTSAKLNLWIMGSLILFGVGTACRWDTIIYGAVIVADMLIDSGNATHSLMQKIRERLPIGILWGVLAISSFLICVAISGYNPLDIVVNLRRYSSSISDNPRRWTDIVGGFQTVFTPAFALVFFLGLITLIRHRDFRLFVVGVGFTIVLPWLSGGAPKYILPAMPSLIACAVLGFDVLWNWLKSSSLKLALQLFIGLLAILPWLIGIRVIYGDSAFGPGFEQRPCDRPDAEKLEASWTLGSGALFPTSEGPRALWGHATVLLGGAWRTVTTNNQQEVNIVTRHAIASRIPLLTSAHAHYFTVALWKEGFLTDDPRDGEEDQLGNPVVERKFVSPNGESVTVFRIDIVASEVESLPGLFPGTKSLIIYCYPRTLHRLYVLAPEAIQQLGNNSAVLDLELLAQEVAAVVVQS